MLVKSSYMWRRAVWAMAIAGVLAGMAPPVQARVFVGVGVPLYVGPPVFAPPPYYGPYHAPPPPYYGPPPGWSPPGTVFNYTPPQAVPRDLAPPRGPDRSGGGYSPSGGYTPSMGGAPTRSGPAAEPGVCRAGPYVCPLIEDVPLGGSCACPSHDGRPVRGRAG